MFGIKLRLKFLFDFYLVKLLNLSSSVLVLVRDYTCCVVLVSLPGVLSVSNNCDTVCPTNFEEAFGHRLKGEIDQALLFPNLNIQLFIGPAHFKRCCHLLYILNVLAQL